MDTTPPPRQYNRVAEWLFDKRADTFQPIDQDYDGDLDSQNEMMVDPEEFVTEQPEDEKGDVAIISPDQLGNDVDIDMVDKPRADNCMFISAVFLFA